MHPFLTELQYESAPTVFTEIGPMRSITPLQGSSEVGNWSHLKSLEAWVEKGRSWKDAGEVPFRLLLKEANLTLVFGLFNKLPNDPLNNFRVVLPLLSGQLTPLKLEVSGILRQMNSSEGAYTSNDPYELDCVLAWSGKPTIIPSTPVP